MLEAQQAAACCSPQLKEWSYATAKQPTEQCEPTGPGFLRSTKKAATAASPKTATTRAAARFETTTVQVDLGRAASDHQHACDFLMSKQYRSLYWPLQMGQPIKSPNFDQQQSKCNKRQLGEESKPSPSIQMH